MYEEYDGEPIPDGEFGARIQWARSIRNRMKAIDAVGWLEIRETAAEWLQLEAKWKEWESLEEYLDYRMAHVANE